MEDKGAAKDQEGQGGAGRVSAQSLSLCTHVSPGSVGRERRWREFVICLKNRDCPGLRLILRLSLILKLKESTNFYRNTTTEVSSIW